MKYTFTTPQKTSVLLRSMPTRLADGLEAKKSSPVRQMRPGFAVPQNFWIPRVAAIFATDFGNLFVAILSKYRLKKQGLFRRSKAIFSKPIRSRDGLAICSWHADADGVGDDLVNGRELARHFAVGFEQDLVRWIES